MSLKKEIELAINKANRENVSNTPDYVLAEYLMNCLKAYEKAISNRSKFFN